ncbi:hypothetical protein GOBAR_DD11158 [Gossypium barbadense]|nr:hypothetical protein GOBAR_DD11158 [Gossypium barbadense]
MFEKLARSDNTPLAVTTGADVVFYMELTDLDTHDFSNCYMIIVQDVFYGSQDILNGDESFAYPGKSKDMTVDLKFEAEGLIRYYTDPSGTFWQCNAKAIGSGSEGADSSLQEQYNKDLTLQEAETIALSILKFDCGMFMLKYIDFYSRGLSLCFEQEHMPYFR